MTFADTAGQITANIQKLREENEALVGMIDELSRCIVADIHDLEDLKTRLLLAQKATIAHASVAQVALTYCQAYKEVALEAIAFVHSDKRKAPQKLQDAVKKLEATLKVVPKA